MVESQAISIKSKRIVYLDYLRVYAAFAVICIHSLKYGSVEFHSVEWWTYTAYNSLIRWAVPVFVMISGVFFLDNKKPLSPKKLYLNNILKLVTAYLFWTIVYRLCFYPQALSVKSLVAEILYSIVYPEVHLWFIPMIVCLYLIVPVLRKITESRKTMRYFLLISLAFTFIVPLVQKIAFFQAEGNIISQANFYFTLGYVPYFVLGYYMNSLDFSKSREITAYILGFIGVVGSFVFTVLASDRQKGINLFYTNGNSIFILLESVSIFVFAKCRLKKFTGKRITVFAKYSFGIYLIHLAVIYVFRKFNINSLTIAPVVGLPLFALLVFCISLFISFILNKIPFINKYIV